MSEDHAFEALRRANPVPLVEAGPPPGLVPDDVFHRIVAGEAGGAVSRRRTRVAFVAVAMVATVTAGWTVLAGPDEPTNRLTVGCYATVDAGGRVEVVVRDGRTPEEICARLWREGVFGGAAVPPLAACVLASGAIGVFPGTGPGVCAAVQGAPAQEPDAAGGPDPVALRLSLLEALHAEGCVRPERAVDLIRRALADGGYQGWTVEVAGTPGPDRPCATLGFDVPGARVVVVPGPRAP
ncbi:MAG: hypothetical protein ACLGI2_17085 [Acidimicrobiia bacterium]